MSQKWFWCQLAWEMSKNDLDDRNNPSMPHECSRQEENFEHNVMYYPPYSRKWLRNRWEEVATRYLQWVGECHQRFITYCSCNETLPQCPKYLSGHIIYEIMDE